LQFFQKYWHPWGVQESSVHSFPSAQLQSSGQPSQVSSPLQNPSPQQGPGQSTAQLHELSPGVQQPSPQMGPQSPGHPQGVSSEEQQPSPQIEPQSAEQLQELSVGPHEPFPQESHTAHSSAHLLPMAIPMQTSSQL